MVLRERPGILCLTALLGICPFMAFNAWLLFPAFREDPGASWLLFVVIALEAPFATAPLTLVLGKLMFREPTSPSRIIRGLLGGLPQMILYQVVVRGICFFPLLLPLLPVRLGFVNEVILLERGKWYRVLKRSGDLAGGRGGELFFYWIVEGIYLLAFTACFWIGSHQFLGMIFEAESLADEIEDGLFFNSRLQLGLWIGLALLGIYHFLLYIDQRIRLEGWQVELRLRAVGASMEDSERW